MFRTSNPALNTFRNPDLGAIPTDQRMTMAGTVNKSAMLIGWLLLGAVWTWHLFYSNGGLAALSQSAGAVVPWLIGGLLGGMVLSLVTIFVPRWSVVTAPGYAVCEGLVLGALSAIVQAQIPQHPIVIQAVALTLGVFGCMLGAYKLGLVRATEKFKLGVLAATGAICLIYMVTLVLRLLHVEVPFIHSAGPIGIIFSLVVITIAALNLVLDFDVIEQGVAQGAPKYMEWYAGFGLLVTLVWLYIEIHRLLVKIYGRSRN